MGTREFRASRPSASVTAAPRGRNGLPPEDPRRAARAFPAWGKKLGEDHVLDLEVVRSLGATAMTHDIAIRMTESGLPNTFVPGRNLLFFTAAAALAYRREIRTLVGGMCETDFSGYPDCPTTRSKALQVALGLGMDTRFTLETPLMWIDKAATFSWPKSSAANRCSI